MQTSYGEMTQADIDRFWSKVDKSGDCWIWIGTCVQPGKRNKLPYGLFALRSQPKYAHRIAYELVNGPLPKELCACHRCDNPRCVRPDHLFAGTIQDNNLDKESKGRARYSSGDEHWFRRHPELIPWRNKDYYSGEQNGRAKLTATQVADIRREFSTGRYSKTELSRAYNISRTQVGRILSGESWQ